MNTEFHTLFEWFMYMYLQNLDGRDSDIAYKNPYLFVTIEPNQIGVSPRCR